MRQSFCQKLGGITYYYKSSLRAMPPLDSSKLQESQVRAQIFFVSSNRQNSGLQKLSNSTSFTHAFSARTWVKLIEKTKRKIFRLGMSLIWRGPSDNWKIRRSDFASGWNGDVIPTLQITYDYPYHIHNHIQIHIIVNIASSKTRKSRHFLNVQLN